MGKGKALKYIITAFIADQLIMEYLCIKAFHKLKEKLCIEKEALIQQGFDQGQKKVHDEVRYFIL